jgi:hypothetical protein
VRRAFLCGPDRLTGKSVDHRKNWIVEKLAGLCAIFAVRVCAYGVLSSHFNLVLCLDLLDGGPRAPDCGALCAHRP